MLAGHAGCVVGVLELNNGRLLSWADDGTLRLWDETTGSCRVVLAGHTGCVLGALALQDGRLLSWARDKTLRLWDGHAGTRLAVMTGHTDCVGGAVELDDGRLVSWSADNTFRLWDGQTGTCRKVIKSDQVANQDPKLLHVYRKAVIPSVIVGDFFGLRSTQSVQIKHKDRSFPLATWETDSDGTVRCLLPNGTLVATQANGQVCILKLCHGSRRMSLAEAGELLPQLHLEQMNHPEVACTFTEEQTRLAPWLQREQETGSEEIDVCVSNRPKLKEPTITDLTENAERCFAKGLWEAAETMYQQLVQKGESLEGIGPKIVTCLLNAHATLNPYDISRIEGILQNLEASGHNTIASELRQKLSEKATTSQPKQSWWKLWK